MNDLVSTSCCKCGATLLRSRPSDWWVCDPCMDIAMGDNADALFERAAVVRYLREHLTRYETSLHSPENQEGRALLKMLADHIEEGGHCER
jgi:hypothetical protein